MGRIAEEGLRRFWRLSSDGSPLTEATPYVWHTVESATKLFLTVGDDRSTYDRQSVGAAFVLRNCREVLCDVPGCLTHHPSLALHTCHVWGKAARTASLGENGHVVRFLDPIKDPCRFGSHGPEFGLSVGSSQGRRLAFCSVLFFF